VADTATQLDEAFDRVTQLVDNYRRDAVFRAPETMPEFKARLLNNVWAALIEGRNVFAIDEAHLYRQREWSERTFGPGSREGGVLDHIRKELVEIADAGTAEDKLSEWVDVVILALDGAWRCGGTPQAILDAVQAKQERNEGRTWPDWRTQPADRAIEHDRSLASRDPLAPKEDA
jgi:hypothetical protein